MILKDFVHTMLQEAFFVSILETSRLMFFLFIIAFFVSIV
jgi:hypothetical protein